jgi:hypothetical protein
MHLRSRSPNSVRSRSRSPNRDRSRSRSPENYARCLTLYVEKKKELMECQWQLRGQEEQLEAKETELLAKDKELQAKEKELQAKDKELQVSEWDSRYWREWGRRRMGQRVRRGEQTLGERQHEQAHLQTSAEREMMHKGPEHDLGPTAKSQSMT